MKNLKQRTITTSYMIGVALWLHEHERNQSWLARKLCVSPASVHYWFEGITKPSKVNKGRIKMLTGVNL